MSMARTSPKVVTMICIGSDDQQQITQVKNEESIFFYRCHDASDYQDFRPTGYSDAPQESLLQPPPPQPTHDATDHGTTGQHDCERLAEHVEAEGLRWRGSVVYHG